MATRLQQALAGLDDRARVGHVLKHFHAGDHVEAARLLGGQVLGGLHAVIDRGAAFQRMQARDLDQFRGQGDGGDVGTGLRQCLAQQATTATDVEHARTAQWHAVGHVLQPHRVQRMQRLLRAVSVPPAVGQRGELVQLGLIEIGGSARI
ncbi:hypothetical protein G6F60_014578 [Rhizopus arrhizus]|nr:hypothetical protein G6F60_014578 [Rhizopus arrhizus]